MRKKIIWPDKTKIHLLWLNSKCCVWQNKVLLINWNWGKEECSQIQWSPWWEPAPECTQQTGSKVHISARRPAAYLKHTAKTMMEWLWDKSLNRPDLNRIALWRDLKMAVFRCFPSNLIEFERICQEDWEKLPKSRCSKLVETYPRRLEAVIAAKILNTGSEYLRISMYRLILCWNGVKSPTSVFCTVAVMAVGLIVLYLLIVLCSIKSKRW